MRHKVVTKGARTATKIGGHVDKTVHRHYRRRVNQDLASLLQGLDPDDINLEPNRTERWTSWDTI